jgi:predicted acetylornithine/succinylornithine family transaminase
MSPKLTIDDSARYLMNTYNRYPIMVRKGRGAKVWGADETEYLDFVGGIATNVLGHCHPKVVVAIQKQTQRLMHVSNLYHTKPQIKLAKLLVNNSFADKVFFCNSGAEAIEAAIKLARKYASEHRPGKRHDIITAQHSFHGRTMGALSATGQEKLQKGFAPLAPGFRHVPFGDIDALAAAMDRETCAVLLEPIQGEAGVRVPPFDYLAKVRQLCTEHGALMVLDEVQTGMGRTGTLFAYEHWGITPDIMTLAKGLGGGFPIGAMLATEQVASVFHPGDHASTFGGNPVACAAGVATLETLIDGGFILDQCRRMGTRLMKKLNAMREEFPSVVMDVRGMGLLLGMEVTRECGPIVLSCLERGLLINCTAGNVLRFMPPLIVQEREIDHMATTLEQVLDRLA